MIDLHSHCLPGLDDGAATLDDSIAICRTAADEGVTVLAATPHVRGRDYPTRAEQMEEALACVRAAVDFLEVVPGGELDLDELARPVDELRRFALAGNRRYLLVETPYVGWPLDLGERLFRLRADGITPVLAHPERNREVQRAPELLDPLVTSGVLVQVTAASLDGREGSSARACAKVLLDRGLAHLLASDAHTADVRAGGLAAAARAVGDEAYARWLTEDVPRAIVEDGQLPSRPASLRPRRRFFRRSV